ncbi:MAG: beta-ketoacyl-[acyl-carrier-protein] synthase II, partial [Planctomycetaceae bacterium]|nr:beta-ketoacyl-[acyl-carrier-protein] synthase II [Planctomycetaceae bacterium]
HGTSTPIGDAKELEAIRAVFGNGTGNQIPYFSSTKSLTGHALGAAGVHEAVYCLLMMEGDFIAASANVEQADPAAEGMPLVTETKTGVRLNQTMTNSFGFGGHNACLVLRRPS